MKMHSKGPYLENTCKQIAGTSSPFVPNLPLQGGFDLSHQHYIRNQARFFSDWRKDPGISHYRDLIRNEISQLRLAKERIFVIAKYLESQLFIEASSQEEYMNRETLMQRLDTQLKKLHGTNCSRQVDRSISCTSKLVPSSGLLHPRASGSLPEPAFQKVAGSITNATYHCTEDLYHSSSVPEPAFQSVDNKYGFPKGDLYHSSIVSGGRTNLEAISKSVSSYFPQRQTDNWEMILMKYGDGSTTKLKNDPMALITTTGKPIQSESNLLTPHRVSRDLAKVSNLFPGSSSLGNVRQQQNHTHLKQAQAVNHEHCRKMLGQKTLEQPQRFPRSFNGDQQFTSESSTGPFGLNGSTTKMNSCSSSKVSLDRRILLEYLYYKNLNIVSRDNVIKYLHSAVCCKGTCTCEWYNKLLLHFDDCKDDGCHTCNSWKLHGTDILERHLEFPKSVIMGPVVRKNDAPSGNSEAALPHAKRRKTESAFGATLISNASLDPLTHKMAQPRSSKALSEFQQQPNSSLSCKYSEATECKSDHISEEPGSKSHDEKPSNITEEAILSLNSSMHTICKKSTPADVEDIQGRIMFNQDGMNATKKVIEPKADQEKERKSQNLTVNNTRDIEDIQARTGFNQDGINAAEKDIQPKADQEKERKSPNPSVADIEDIQGKTGFNQNGMNATKKVIQPKADQKKERKSPNPIVNTAADIEGMQGRTGFYQDGINATKMVIEPKADQEKEWKSPIPTVNTAVIEDIQGRTGFNQDGINTTKKVVEPKADQEKERKSPNPNTVSLTDFFTSNQIKEHITSLRKQFNQSTMVEESGIDVSKCQLCGMGTLSFAPVPIYCFCCGIRIKRNAYYYYRREEDDTQHCFCTVCFRTSRGGNITFNGTSVSKSDLDKKTNNREFEEAWVECNKCKSWHHQICALYNDKRDLDYNAEYTCPICRLKEFGNGMHAPLPKTAMFGAKDLPRTMLSDHIERRLFKRLKQENEDWAKVEGNKNLDEVLEEETLSVRVVLSVDKQLEVKKQFLDIFGEENYPAEFSYTSKVILLFQKIEGVDVCLFSMYVQEFGSECGYPNQRCVYVSYLDSVKYFRPERQTKSGEALRTIVYHEILIGYLDFCKKRGFTTCYIWACPPIKGEDYILYCHPDTQKTPKKDKLRHWYHSMLRKAAEENIVVGLTNIHDHFFVTTGNYDSKVTAARLPYFDGDFWSGAAMDKARHIEQETGGDYKMIFEKVVSKRCLKSMGYLNPSKGAAKDILVMYKLGQTILPFKEDFIIAQFHYVCMHCHEVIASGKRWFCTKCKNFQECERCHTADTHFSVDGERHKLCQVLKVDILGDTKENDIILDNGLLDTRYNFLSFCQRNRFQFDSLRRAKHSSMMILYFLKNPTLMTVGTICRVCCKNDVSQRYWKCENCPEFTVCSSCYKERGANCHAHTLTQAYAPAQSPSGNQELKQNSEMLQELLDVIKHASLCRSTKSQPCTYPHCRQIKKLFSHASRCTIRVSGGCQFCKKVWQGLALHSRNCRDSACRIPRCMDLKKQAEWIATQSEWRRRAAVLEDCKEHSVQ